MIVVDRTYSDGRLAPYGKTGRSRRRVPLSPRAEEALRSLPARIDTRLLFPAVRGGYIDLHTWRNREWYPALEAAGLSVFELARVMGTSVDMIDRTYGHLARGSEEHMRPTRRLREAPDEEGRREMIVYHRTYHTDAILREGFRGEAMIPAGALNEHLQGARVLTIDEETALTVARWEHWKERFGQEKATRVEGQDG